MLTGVVANTLRVATTPVPIEQKRAWDCFEKTSIFNPLVASLCSLEFLHVLASWQEKQAIDRMEDTINDDEAYNYSNCEWRTTPFRG
jgi:hypothetical protein